MYYMKDQVDVKSKMWKLWNMPFCEFWAWPAGVIQTGAEFLAGKAKPEMTVNHL